MIRDEPRSVRFDIRTDGSTQALCRVIALFAQRDEAIAALSLTCEDNGQRLTITLPWPGEDRTRIVAERMRAIIAVRSVTMPAAI